MAVAGERNLVTAETALWLSTRGLGATEVLAQVSTTGSTSRARPGCASGTGRLLRAHRGGSAAGRRSPST
jgi:hypothetical protein